MPTGSDGKHDDCFYNNLMFVPPQGRQSCFKPSSSPMHYEVTSIRNLDSAECTYLLAGHNTYFYAIVNPNHTPETIQSNSESCHTVVVILIALHSLLGIHHPSSGIRVPPPVVSPPTNPRFETPSPSPSFNGQHSSPSTFLNPSYSCDPQGPGPLPAHPHHQRTSIHHTTSTKTSTLRPSSSASSIWPPTH